MKLNRTKLARLADVLQEMVDTGFVAGEAEPGIVLKIDREGLDAGKDNLIYRAAEKL